MNNTKEMPVTPDAQMAAPAPPAPGLPRSQGSTDNLNVYDDARTYYTAEERHRNNRAGPRTRTYSQVRRHRCRVSRPEMGAIG